MRKMTEVGQSGHCEWLNRTGVAIVSGWTVLKWALSVAERYWRGHNEWMDRTEVGTVSG